MQKRFTQKLKLESPPKSPTPPPKSPSPPPKSPTPPPRSPTPPPKTPGPREAVERSPREILSIHVGQAGIQIGAASWQLFCYEHGINADGTIPDDSFSNWDNSYETFFYQSAAGKAVPRAVMVDLEPSVVDAVKNSIYGSLYNPRMFINGKEDAAGSYARGKYTIGEQIIDSLMDTIQKAKEQCNALQGILVYHSYGGGTGSGLTANMMERLNESKVPVMNIPIFTSPKYSSSVVEPYNALLFSGAQIRNDFSGCSILMDNQALYNICESYLDVEIPSFYNTNRLVAQAVSMLTAPLRFGDPASANFSNVINSLVPGYTHNSAKYHIANEKNSKYPPLDDYKVPIQESCRRPSPIIIPQPRLKYLTFACAPLVSPENKTDSKPNSVHEMSQLCYRSENQFLTLEKKESEGPFLASALLYRGYARRSEMDQTITNMNKEFSISKNGLRLTNWNPSEIKEECRKLLILKFKFV